MGGHPYYYAVPHQRDISIALQALRTREFEVGRYNSVTPFLNFQMHASRMPSPGRQHASIEAALEASDADGTRSILDIERIGDYPTFGVAVRLAATRLQDFYGTDKPSREMVAQNMAFFDEIERGHAIYFILFQGETPSEVFFAGISFE